MALSTAKRSRLADTFGTAPRRIGPGVWVTRTGRNLGPDSAAYWEHHFRQGLTDGRGHLTAPARALRSTAVAEDIARQPTTTRAQPGLSLHDRFRAALARERVSPAALIPGTENLSRETHDIISGIPRFMWTVGRDTGRAPFELIAHPGKEPSLTRDVYRPLVENYKYRYGPLARGDGHEFVQRLKESPLSFGLDLWGLAGGTGTAAIKGGRFAAAEGSLRERAVASRQQPAREVLSGEASVPINQSPNEVAALIQRRVLDPLSYKLQGARDAGYRVPGWTTSDVRAAKQTYRDTHQQVHRERQSMIQNAKALAGMPRKARVRLWNDLQTPGVPAEEIAHHLDTLADTTLEEGTASARRTAAAPTRTYESAVAYRDRLAGLVKRMQARDFEVLRARAGEALRAPKETGRKPPVQAPLGHETPPEAVQPELGDPSRLARHDAPAADPTADLQAQFEKVDRVWQAMVNERASHYQGELTDVEKRQIYQTRAQFNKENSPKARGHGRRGYTPHKPKLPGEVYRDRAIEDLHRLASGEGNSTLQRALRKIIAEHERLSGELSGLEGQHFDFLFGKGKPPEEVAPPAPAEQALVSAAMREMPKPKVDEGPKPLTLEQLKGALAVAEDRVRRFQPRTPTRDLEREQAEATRLKKQAEKVRRTGDEVVPDEARKGAEAITKRTEENLLEAGVLKPDEAQERSGLMMRALGREPTGQEVYVHHGVKERLRASSVVRRAGLEGRAKPPAGVGEQNTLALFESGRVHMDPREAVRRFEQSLAYRFHTKVREYFAKVGRPIGPEGPHKGWYVVDPDAPHRAVRREQYAASPQERASAEGVSIDEAFGKQVEEYVRSYIAKAGSEDAATIASRAREDGAEPVQVSPEVYAQFVNPRMVGGTRTTTGEALSSTADLVRASLIYANPGYVPANLIGNALFLTTEQGVHAPANVARSAARLLKTGPGARNLAKADRGELRDLLRAEVGMGATVSVAGVGRGPVHALVQKLARAEGFVADDWMRLASWIRQARKEGVRTPEQQLEFLRTTVRGDPEAEKLANKIKARMEERMVSFDRLAPRERDFASKWLFVWPWVRGASRYPLTTVRDMPVRSALLSSEGEQAMKDPSQDIGFPTPAWLEPAFRVSPARLVLPRAASTVSTPMEVLSTLSDAVSGRNDKSIADIMHPFVRASMDVAQGRNRFGQQVGAWGALKQEVEGLSPLYSTGKGLVDPSSEPKIYGKQTWKSVLQRRVGRGLYPFSVDERVAYTQARKTMSPRERWKGDTLWLTRDYQQAIKGLADHHGMADRLQAAIGWQHYRAVARLDFYKEHAKDPKKPTAIEKLTADLYVLKQLGRISPEKADEILASEWEHAQHPLTAGRVSHRIADLGRRYFYTDAFSRADHAIKKAGRQPPRRPGLP